MRISITLSGAALTFGNGDAGPLRFVCLALTWGRKPGMVPQAAIIVGDFAPHSKFSRIGSFFFLPPRQHFMHRYG